MRPKGKLFALLAVFAAIGLITASGAFTTVSADRTADVDVQGDQSALLALNVNNSSGNSGYASFSSDQLQITLNQINLDATTDIEFVFDITNNGDEPVNLWITRTGPYAGVVGFYNGTVQSSNNITTSANSQTLNSGTSAKVSIRVDTTENTDITDSDTLLTEITIHAEAA